MKRVITLLTVVLFMSFLVSSCMMTKTQVGTYKEQQGDKYKYAKGKQYWLFWGILPIGRTSVNTPSDGNCEIVTKHKLGDVLISTLTGGMVISHTIKVNAKRGASIQESAKTSTIQGISKNLLLIYFADC